MDTERWKKIDALFDAVLNLPESERDEFLSRECRNDEELKNEVLALLGAAAPTNFLERSAIGVAARKLAADKDRFVEQKFLGRTLGTYKVEKQLAAGGMGEIYLATDSKFYRKVALKILPSEYTLSDERLKRFELEAHAISCINHPNIVTIYDVGTQDGINFIATELVEGKNLHDAAGDLDVTAVLDVGIQVCEALSAAHRAGIIHRDIKPENIMLRPDGYVKVLDFGLAKLSIASRVPSGAFNQTAEGVIMGTPGYMSPEQIAGERVDYRTDLWSLGVILFELLTGRNPFKGTNRQKTFTAILDVEPPPASSINRAVPPELDDVLAKAIAKSVDARFQSPTELSAELKRVRRLHDISTLSTTVSPDLIRRTSTRNFAAVGMIILVIAATAFAVFWLTRGDSRQYAVDWSKARSVHLTNAAGTEYFPALSPDASTFVYASDQGGNFDIYSQRIGGTTPLNLTPNSVAADTQPAFSSDGKLIAFRSEREPRGIYTMETTGENPRRVSDFGFHPSFSPSGKEIVVSTFGDDLPTVRRSGPRGIFIVNIETGAKREVSGHDASFPTWSPNGKFVAFWFYPGLAGRRDVAVVNLENGNEVVLTKDFGVSNWNPVWSPDGRFVYFISDRNGSVNFWRIEVDPETCIPSGAPEPVVTPSIFSRHLNFSRDGSKMIYVQSNNQANIQGVGFDPEAGKIVGNPFWITTGDREVTRAEVAPNGHDFLMRRIRRTQDDIVTYDRETNAWFEVTSDEPFDRYPRWSPKGDQIAFVSDRGGNYEIWMIAPDGSNARQITFVGQSETGTSFPSWSPDGNELIYTANRRSYIMDLRKGWNEQVPRPLPLPPDGSSFAVWDWSPDGKSVVGTFAQVNRAVGTYSFETGQFKRLVELQPSDPLAIPSWLPDSRRIVLRVDRKIFVIDTVTGARKEVLSETEGEIRSPFVSRDGKLLYYSVHIEKSDIWLLDTSTIP